MLNVNEIEPMAGQYSITVVISTYNRRSLLAAALESILRQAGPEASYEVIVVDNNSTDDTRHVVQGYIEQNYSNLRYILEPRQGVSYARNTGIAHSRAPIVAFIDDDVRASNEWIVALKRAFEANPSIDCVGGKVLPHWTTKAPEWLNRNHWMPLGLLDYGDSPIEIGSNNPLCLLSANLACRQSLFQGVGAFSTTLQRVKDGIGSIEDAELLERCWRAGRRCLYVPEMVVTTEVPLERMTKKYHRRWHTGHGRFLAIQRSDEMERSSGRLFDVPAHLYRQSFNDAIGWLKCSLAKMPAQAFAHESRIRFFWGFFRKRRSDYIAGSHTGAMTELAALLRSRTRKNREDISGELG